MLLKVIRKGGRKAAFVVFQDPTGAATRRSFRA
jgi:hypothetical protein